MRLRPTFEGIANLLTATLAGYFAVLLVCDLLLGMPLETSMIVILCAVGAVLSLLLFLVPASLRMKISLLAVSMLSALVVVEFVLALRGYRTPTTTSEAAGAQVDTRSKLEVVQDSQRAGKPAVPFTPPLALSPISENAEPAIAVDGVETVVLSQVSNRDIVICNETGVWEIWRSDRYGFTNPPDVWDRAPVDVVAIGDSFTQGFCVPQGTDMVSVVRRSFPATVNLGMGHTGPLTQLATLREYGPVLQPRIVVWFYFEGNDLSDLRREQAVPLLQRYLDAAFDQDLIHKQSQLDTALLAHIATAQEEAEFPGKAWVWRAHNLLSLRYLRSMVGVRFDPGYDDLFPQYAQILRTGKELVESWDGRLVFVYLPDWPRYLSSSAGGVLDHYHDRVLETMGAVGAPVVDVSAVFAARSDPTAMWPRSGEVHYSRLGNEVAGQAVIDALQRRDR